MKATCIVSVRVSVETRDKWREIAKAKGLSVGKMLQDAVVRSDVSSLTRNEASDRTPVQTDDGLVLFKPVVTRPERPFTPFTKADQLGRKK